MNMQPSVHKVLVVDDHPLFREGLISLFRFAPEFEVVEGVGNVQDAIARAIFHSRMEQAWTRHALFLSSSRIVNSSS